MELSLRLASCEMKSMPSLLMAQHALIAMMTRRTFTFTQALQHQGGRKRGHTGCSSRLTA